MKAVLSLKFICLTETSVCPSVSFCVSLTLSLFTLGTSPEGKPLCSRSPSTGGKHVLQISLYVYVCLCFCMSAFLSDSLTSFFLHECRERKINFTALFSYARLPITGRLLKIGALKGCRPLFGRSVLDN